MVLTRSEEREQVPAEVHIRTTKGVPDLATEERSYPAFPRSRTRKGSINDIERGMVWEEVIIILPE